MIGSLLGPYRVLEKLGKGGPAFARARIPGELRRDLAEAQETRTW